MKIDSESSFKAWFADKYFGEDVAFFWIESRANVGFPDCLLRKLSSGLVVFLEFKYVRSNFSYGKSLPLGPRQYHMLTQLGSKKLSRSYLVVGFLNGFAIMRPALNCDEKSVIYFGGYVGAVPKFSW